MSLVIRGKDDLKKMIGYHIDDVAIVQGGVLQLTLSHIAEPGVKYLIGITPIVTPALNGNILMIDRGLSVQSTGVVVPLEDERGQT